MPLPSERVAAISVSRVAHVAFAHSPAVTALLAALAACMPSRAEGFGVGGVVAGVCDSLVEQRECGTPWYGVLGLVLLFSAIAFVAGAFFDKQNKSSGFGAGGPAMCSRASQSQCTYRFKNATPRFVPLAEHEQG